MSVILITHWIAARQARDLAESVSPDPLLRRAARLRALLEVMRRETRLRQPVPAQVIALAPRRPRRTLRHRLGLE